MCKCSQKEVKDEATPSRICGATLPRFTKSFFSVEHISSRSAAQTWLHHNILFFMANIATSLLFSYNAISFPVPSIFSHLLAYSVLALMPTRLIYRDAPKKYIVCARSRSRGHLETHVRVQMHQGCEYLIRRQVFKNKMKEPEAPWAAPGENILRKHCVVPLPSGITAVLVLLTLFSNLSQVELQCSLEFSCTKAYRTNSAFMLG